MGAVGPYENEGTIYYIGYLVRTKEIIITIGNDIKNQRLTAYLTNAWDNPRIAVEVTEIYEKIAEEAKSNYTILVKRKSECDFLLPPNLRGIIK